MDSVDRRLMNLIQRNFPLTPDPFTQIGRQLGLSEDEIIQRIKRLKTQNLRDHMSEAELIFTALAELSSRQIAESVDATGMAENAEAGKKGGRIAKKARLELEHKTGRKVVTSENFLPPVNPKKKLSESTE